tara:strand:+ start:275 stop:865 length:591 start_codon:yes stop_codon:yes gene_type:complete
MKTINIQTKTITTKNNKIIDEKPEKTDKIREKIVKFNKQNSLDPSNNFILAMKQHSEQVKTINNLYMGSQFEERNFILSELKAKINSYKQQDIKKDYHEYANLITLDNVIEKLVSCKLKCYYCNKNMKLFFEKVRDEDQWTLDRINNYDEHSNENTIVCCLKCNLQRRRKNSDKFLFTKQLENNIIKIKKSDSSIN